MVIYRYFTSDAENVVQKEQQIMTDDKFPQDVLLTVFPFSTDVFFYISRATVDLTVLGSDQASLICSLRSAHRSVRFQPLPHQKKATIEGPFAAIKVLREDLIRRACELKAAVPTTVKLKEPPLSATSHHNLVSCMSCSSYKAEQEPADSNSFSKALLSAGEAIQVQSLLSKAKTPHDSSKHKVSSAPESFSLKDSVEEQLGTLSTLKRPTEHRAKQTADRCRQMRWEEINARIRSSLSSLDLVPAENASAKDPGVHNISQKHNGPGRISATKTRTDTHLNSCHNSSTDSAAYQKESDQSSSAVTTDYLQTRPKHVCMSSESNSEDKELSASCAKDVEDSSIWIDSHTFRYIETFHKEKLDRCLRGLQVSVECAEGGDLVKILLTVNQTSKAASVVQKALKELKTLVETWTSMLRVHEIPFEQERPSQKQKLIQICRDVTLLYNDIVYMFEDSCLKIVGPSLTSYLFYERVKDQLNSKLVW
ncbi:uncharacterized protein LOC115055167 isoform X2 [Echeneis naucrates]|uniref:uncharacterized protein LOC115055167 isoform X2 n=1 Tax=Echeneis naucrates TaxID=173247 RepID=UPI001113B2B1|nr:RNA-binding protein 43 isoform X2 [Echeneis naucrates]